MTTKMRRLQTVGTGDIVLRFSAAFYRDVKKPNCLSRQGKLHGTVCGTVFLVNFSCSQSLLAGICVDLLCAN